MTSISDCRLTAFGAVSPAGRGAETLFNSLLAGKNALRPISVFNPDGLRNAVAGEVEGYLVSDDTGLPRAYRMLRDAVSEALAAADSGARRPLDRSKTALILGTNFGCVSIPERVLATPSSDAPAAEPDGSLGVYPFDETAAQLAREFCLGGARMIVSLSCASGAAIVGIARDLLNEPGIDSVVAAGFDELTLTNYSGLSGLRAITPDIIRPFDAERNGTQFSEGAGCVILENATRAERRGMESKIAVLGWAANNDAYHMTAPDQDGTGIIAVMRAAIKDAGIEPDAIEYINAHATGTQYNDLIETRAIKAVFGERATSVPIAANKSVLGHGMGAAGVWELISTAYSMTTGKLPPTASYQTPDPDLNLDYSVGEVREKSIKTAMSCSYGFGGTNAVVVLAVR
ncbi:MAG: beta-ketoacyl-[acyl-carrier-protein] synthase family protein [Planctomycetota bacterium]